MMAVKDRYGHPDWPYVCDEYCKVHWYWDYESKMHIPYPGTWDIKMEAGWVKATVFVGPPAYNPKKPTQQQMTNMEMYCPHVQGDLTCNTCLRHTFRPLEI
jgi:hypothetical protein